MRNPLQVVRLLGSVTRLTLDLNRLSQVFEINDALIKLRSPAEDALVMESFRRVPAVAEALRTRPRLGASAFEHLDTLPADSLGATYRRFMHERGLRPESIPSLEGASDIDYLVAHLYETHDLWHVVTGFDTDPAGEAALQAFYLAQQHSYLPFFVLSAILLNTALFAYAEKDRRLDAIVCGWNLGKTARPLVGIDWRPWLARPLADVRRELGVQP